MKGGAFGIAFVLAVAPPDCSAVFVGGVPYLTSVISATVTANVLS